MRTKLKTKIALRYMRIVPKWIGKNNDQGQIHALVAEVHILKAIVFLKIVNV